MALVPPEKRSVLCKTRIMKTIGGGRTLIDPSHAALLEVMMLE
jgi:hypothetical protein